ncbi:ABC transporter permease [Candidatus Bathyarchaeota archaeon B24-2]|nr:MAG: ABC transporter permease [Candidatus Bathyarchaeota archaeon B24-2]
MNKILSKLYELVIWIIGIALFAFFFFPIYWMVVTSIKSNVFNPSILPVNPSLKSYLMVVYQLHDKTSEFWIQLWNSFIVAFGTITFSLSVSIFCAYAFSRLKFKLRKAISYATLFTYIVPTSFLAIPFFILMMNYGLLDNLLSVIIATGTFSTPYCIWVLSEYMSSIPIEIEEAAMTDGAGRFRIFISIVLPLLTPALIAMGTYAFIYGWNEYLYVFILISKTQRWTIPLSIGAMLTSDDVPWGIMMAMSTIYSIPPVIFYYLFKRYMIAGLVRGAVKR